MSRTWRPRAKGGRKPQSRPTVRLCCQTPARDPHAPLCQRRPDMCGIKRAFETPSHARRSVRRLLRETPGLLWREYECPECGFWHLTTSL